jgi:hypothetical protein
MLLPDNLIQRARAHALGERLGAGGRPVAGERACAGLRDAMPATLRRVRWRGRRVAKERALRVIVRHMPSLLPALGG